ncbi:hypothetical protein Pcal_1493 [Pyrobaculum calidifontis JCM 11548]|uniref:Uncharacterized protein n=2 Tax=Pyrobaculum calidifontis TaxID=181486 RepID=A3MW95_PYRCJ|nr:hypothetical protein Pcal_1493 [Pyrobaculum calidifontis JCM 11548]
MCLNNFTKFRHMKYLVLLIAPFAIAITVAPGIEVEVVNKTTLTIVTDVVVAVKVNNTALSQHLGEDVYTIAVLHLRFNCGAKGEKTMHYVFQNPQNTATLSLSQTLMDACAGEETAVEFLNATFIVVTRGGVVKDVYYLDIAEAAKRAGQSLVFTPEWRALAFNVKTRVVDLCNWLQIDLAGKYGGDIGLLKIVSWYCFNRSKALRIAYQPYYYYLAKYIQVKVTLNVGNVTVEKDLSGGGEILLEPSKAWGNVTYFKVEIAGPQNRYAIYPMNYTGPISIQPPTVEYRTLAGVVVGIRQTALGVQYDVLLNDTVSPEGLALEHALSATLFAEVAKPSLLTIRLLPLEATAGGNVTVVYTGPGVVKKGVVQLPQVPAQPITLEKKTPLVVPHYYSIQLTQPQPLMRLEIPRLPNAVAAYVEMNVTARPRDPLRQTALWPILLMNKSGVLIPLPPTTLFNSTNSGRYAGYINGTVRLRYLLPMPPGDYVYLVFYLYGDNLAAFKVESGYAYVLTLPQNPQLAPKETRDVLTAAIFPFIAILAILIRRLAGHG